MSGYKWFHCVHFFSFTAGADRVVDLSDGQIVAVPNLDVVDFTPALDAMDVLQVVLGFHAAVLTRQGDLVLAVQAVKVRQVIADLWTFRHERALLSGIIERGKFLLWSPPIDR